MITASNAPRRWRLLAALALVSLVDAAPILAGDSPVKFLRAWGSRGDKPGEFHFPIGIAISTADEVFVADHYNNRVQRFSGEGKLLAVLPVLQHPGAVAINSEGLLYITHFAETRPKYEKTPDRLTVYSQDGKLLHQWDRSGKGDGEFDCPGGIAFDREGNVYIADQTNRRVQVLTKDAKFLRKWGEYGLKPGQFGGDSNPRSRVGGPQFLAIDRRGFLYTTEGSVCRIQKFTTDGKFLKMWGDKTDRPGNFGGLMEGGKGGGLKGPIAICVDLQDRLWISSVRGRIQRFSVDGEFQIGFGEEQGGGPGQFLAPHGIAVNSRGELYVVDAYNHRIQQFAVLK